MTGGILDLFVLAGPTPLAGEGGSCLRIASAPGSALSPAPQLAGWWPQDAGSKAAGLGATCDAPPHLAPRLEPVTLHHPCPEAPALLPPAVMDQLTAVVGRPAMMPYWALGWHQCK